MKNIFLTYATEAFIANAKALAESARKVGFDDALTLGPEDLLKTDFYRANEVVLTEERGAGYWLWKPFVILMTLQRLEPGDLLFYSDAGRANYYRFSRWPGGLIDKVRSSTQGFLLGATTPHLGPICQWTKRDCLVLMNADEESLFDAEQIQATWSLWTPTETAKAFARRWLDFCCDPRCLTDAPNECGLPNYPEFRDHRHDQSILSILAHQTEAPRLDFRHTLVHKLIQMRPGSALSHTFYKRPQNADDLLRGDNPYLLVREYVRLKRAR